MIPNVTINWCQRQAQCKWCPDQIEAGSPMVSVFFWRKGEDNRKLNIKMYYHPQCWVSQGLDYLKMNPYVPYERHKRTELTPEQRQLRLKLLRDKGRLDQRRKELKSTGQKRVVREAAIDTKIARLIVQMIEVGGVPKRWLENL